MNPFNDLGGLLLVLLFCYMAVLLALIGVVGATALMIYWGMVRAVPRERAVPPTSLGP